MKPYVVRVVGLVVTVAFTILMVSFMGVYIPAKNPTNPPSPMPQQLWLWTYRGFDVLFLCLLIFATIVGAAALFRPEEAPRGAVEEEAFVEEPLMEEEEVEE